MLMYIELNMMIYRNYYKAVEEGYIIDQGKAKAF